MSKISPKVKLNIFFNFLITYFFTRTFFFLHNMVLFIIPLCTFQVSPTVSYRAFH